MSKWKKFEELVKESLEGTHHRRIKTRMSGYKGDSEIADFYAFMDGTLHYFEVKHTEGDTFPFSMIQPSQLVGLWEANTHEGVYGSVVLSLGQDEEYYIIPIESINRMIKNNKMSMNREDLRQWALSIEKDKGKLPLQRWMKSISKDQKGNKK